MYYEMLSQEYLKEAETLKKHIKKLRTQCVVANSNASDEINYRISIIYSMYLDLIHTAKYLSRKNEVMKK